MPRSHTLSVLATTYHSNQIGLGYHWMSCGVVEETQGKQALSPQEAIFDSIYPAERAESAVQGMSSVRTQRTHAIVDSRLWRGSWSRQFAHAAYSGDKYLSRTLLVFRSCTVCNVGVLMFPSLDRTACMYCCRSANARGPPSKGARDTSFNTKHSLTASTHFGKH